MEEERVKLLTDIFKSSEIEKQRENYFKEQMRKQLYDIVNMDVEEASTRLLSDQLRVAGVFNFVDS